jgi:peroxiredoxin
VVLYFYPYDFSKMCNEELQGFNDRLEDFKRLDCQVLGCSMDS